MSRIQEYIERVDAAIIKAINHQTKLTSVQLGLEGMSSNKNRVLLNELVKDDDRYLEIGVWKGSTFVSALYGNKPEYAVAIDNFSQFEGARQKFFDVCTSNGLKDYIFINNDCFNLTPEEKAFISNMNVYFYDGDHREIDQRLALSYYMDTLSNEFIFIVDDWNHEPARIGTRQGIIETGIKIHKEWELRCNSNGEKDSWWNGLYLAVCEKVKV